MKKILVAAILGMVTCVATVSYGQGSIVFDNYISSPYMPVLYANGDGAGASVHLNLLYGFGTVSDVSGLTSLNLDVPVNPSLVDSFGHSGYISSVVANIPGYTSGPVTFAVQAWDTATGADYASALVKGTSFLWQEPSLATGLATAANFVGLPGPNGSALVTLVPVPEPTTFALAGLGIASMLIFRRRKA